MRYAVSGSNADTINPATASSSVYVLGKAIGTGRDFWLRGVSIAPNATSGPVLLVDATSGATVTGAVVSLNIDPLSNETQVFNFGSPGLKFETGCCAIMSASGSIGVGQISGWGFETE